MTWKEAPRFRLHACWCRFASVHGYRCRRRRTRFLIHQSPPEFTVVMLRQSIGSFGAVVFFLKENQNTMGFFLTNKKRRYNNKFISSLNQERSWHVEVYHPHLSKMGRFASIVGSHQWKVYGFLFFAHCLLNDPLWCPCGPNGLGQVGGLVDESGSSGMKSYPRDEVIAGKIVFVSCTCFFFLWDWKTLKEQRGQVVCISLTRSPLFSKKGHMPVS